MRTQPLDPEVTGLKDMAERQRNRHREGKNGGAIEREVNKLLESLDSSVEMRRSEEEEEGLGRRSCVFWGFSSSPLRPVDLPGCQTVWSWWWGAGVQS